MSYEAIAFNRFRWHNVPPEVGDVERILTFTGLAVYDTERKIVRPVTAFPNIQLPYEPIQVGAYGDTALTGEHYWDALIEVAPARTMLMHLQQVMREIDTSEVVQTQLARQTRAIKSKDKTADTVKELASMSYTTPIPVLEVSSALGAEDIIPIGDGDTHATPLRNMHDVAMSRFCQMLGVHHGDTIKPERLVADEVETAHCAVDLIRANEIAQRQKLADWAGWELEVLI